MKSNDIVITDFQKGIAESPHMGFADIRNLDLSMTPGVAQLGYLPSKVSSTTITSLPKWIRRDPNTGTFYCLDASGVLYKSSGGGSWSLPSHSPANTSTGQGLAIWKGYVWVFRATGVDLMKISDDTWTNAWGGLTLSQASTWHPGLAGQDDILYIGSGRYIDSVAEKAGQTFDPASAATYTVSAKALSTIPAYYTIKCLAELGVNLMIGTSLGSDNTQFRVADIFPWDRTSPTFRLPIRIPENGVNQLYTVNNILYIQAGLYGTLYYYNGAQVQELKRFKNISYAGTSDVIDTYPDAITFHNDKLLTGHVFLGAGTSPTPMGVWGLKGNTLTFENHISTANAGGTSGQLAIGALFSSGNTVLVGWRDNTTYGIDSIVTNGATRYTSYAGYVDSPLIQVGSRLNRRTFTQIEFQLAQPLTTGQGIKISYRKDLASSFTVLGTYDYATYAGISSYTDAAPITDAEFIQLRIALTTGSSSSTSPQLREVHLR